VFCLVEDGCAVGVRLMDGSEQRADIVVSNANGHATIFQMLGGRYTSPAIRAYYDAPDDRVEMGIHVSLGVARALPAEPHAIVLPLAEPVKIADRVRDRLYVEPFAFDPSLAPPGKSVVKVVMAASFAYWQKLYRMPERYHAEKQRITDCVIGRMSQILPGLGNFYMVGQWAGLPGIPTVAAMGRDVVRAICRSDRRTFWTTPAEPRERRPGSADRAATAEPRAVSTASGTGTS
jgi:phytoene dehydrogenase-like protein